MEKLKVAILISGRGSNMRALVEAAEAAHYPARIVGVLSNEAAASGLAFARDKGIAIHVIPHHDFPTREAFDGAVTTALMDWGAELICLAGFMRILGIPFVRRWEGRILNIHPSLLPAFRGLHTHRRVLDAGVRFTGCTVHFVTAALDSGPIIGQAVVPVRPGDSEETLSARVLKAEHRLYPHCLALVAGGRARLKGDTVVLADTTAPDTVLFSPALGD